jgi:hypothetical protein
MLSIDSRTQGGQGGGRGGVQVRSQDLDRLKSQIGAKGAVRGRKHVARLSVGRTEGLFQGGNTFRLGRGLGIEDRLNNVWRSWRPKRLTKTAKAVEDSHFDTGNEHAKQEN